MDLDEIKRSVNLIEYAKTHWGYKCDSKGRGSCLLHPPDNHKSFSIWQDDNGIWRFKCFHDGTTGTIVDLKAALENKSIEECIKELKEEFNSKKPLKRKIKEANYYVYKDLEGRDFYRKVKQTYEDKSKGYWIELKDKNGWRNPGENERYKKLPYNLHKFKDYSKLIFCEGEKDADTVNELKTSFLATSAPFGCSSWPDEINSYLSDFTDIIYLYDVGNEGNARKHAAKVQYDYPEINIYIAKVPLKEREADTTDYLSQFYNPLDNNNLETRKKKLLEVLSKNVEKFEIKEEKPLEKGIKPILTSLDSIDPEPVEWLWFNRIPLGKLSLIVGDPGNGKSFLGIYLAAHVTTGDHWPDIGAPILKGSVIILTAEDGLADTVRIRADAVGANVKKIKILEGIINKEGEQEFFNIKEHLQALKQAIKQLKDVRLVIIDPITAYLGKVDSHKTSEVRNVLAPLVSLAEKHKFAIVAITHLNKNDALKAIYRTMGSLAFIATARAVWAISKDDNDEGSTRRLFFPLKTNLSINPTGLAFNIVDTQVVFEEQPVDVNVEEALSKEKSEETTALDEATTWLKEALEDSPIAAADIFRMAKDNHISDATLRRAKKRLNVQSYKEGIRQEGKWFWKLP